MASNFQFDHQGVIAKKKKIIKKRKEKSEKRKLGRKGEGEKKEN